MRSDLVALRRRTLPLRAAILQAVRDFFCGHGYLEVETPVRLPAVAPEAHIAPLASGAWFLQTSPELCMKRLLSQGLSRIFQFARCFREGERGRLHLPECTLLEWYRIDSDYQDLMDECEALLPFVLNNLGRDAILAPAGAEPVHLTGPWPRLTVAEAFTRYAPCSLVAALARGIFDETLVQHVEPRLGRGKPLFLYDYPLSLAALAKKKKDDPLVAERFELYVAGVELANGFSELIDPIEQRTRFVQEQERIRGLGRDPGPLPEPFLRDLATMPSAAGIALGLDRLVMLIAGLDSIDASVAFTPEEL